MTDRNTITLTPASPNLNININPISPFGANALMG